MKSTLKITAMALGALLMSFTPANNSLTIETEGIYSKNKTTIKWKSVELDLGEIEHNKPKTLQFEFVNTGEVAVIISNVQAGCGCTATNYSKEPIAPGQSAKISATYNAATLGAFKKTVTVTTNAEEAPRVLSFKGTVI